MMETQERAREEALAAIHARGNAIGDIATRDKLAAERRRLQEEERLVLEAREAAARARELEEEERREVRLGGVGAPCSVP
jgi:hypothetical protein